VNKLNGASYRQAAGSARQLLTRPSHVTADVLIQLLGNEGIAQNGSFVLNYSQLNRDALNPRSSVAPRDRDRHPLRGQDIRVYGRVRHSAAKRLFRWKHSSGSSFRLSV
jgi:hypothetical protein